MDGGCSTQWEIKTAYKILAGKPKEKDHLEDRNVDRRIISKWILRKYDVRVWTGFMCHRIWTGGGLL
jgi:hypothetical protein